LTPSNLATVQGDIATDTAKIARKQERRQQLLDAAVEAIRQHGPAATMEQLSAAGGVTKPILYRHFGDRDGLIQAIGSRFAIELLTQVQGPLTSTAPEPRKLLESTVDSYLSFIERDTNLYRFLIQQRSGRGASIAEPNAPADLIGAIARSVALVIGEQLRTANLDSGPAEPWAYGIVGLVHLAGDWWLDHRTMPRERLTQYLTSLLWDGFGGQTTAQARDTQVS
jgi:AcrR family transcriptional regulator